MIPKTNMPGKFVTVCQSSWGEMNAWSFKYLHERLTWIVWNVRWGDTSVAFTSRPERVRRGDDISCCELSGEENSAAEGKFITVSWKIWSWRYSPFPASSHDSHTALGLMSTFESRYQNCNFFFFSFFTEKCQQEICDANTACQNLGNNLKQLVDLHVALQVAIFPSRSFYVHFEGSH